MLIFENPHGPKSKCPCCLPSWYSWSRWVCLNMRCLRVLKIKVQIRNSRISVSRKLFMFIVKVFSSPGNISLKCLESLPDSRLFWPLFLHWYWDHSYLFCWWPDILVKKGKEICCFVCPVVCWSSWSRARGHCCWNSWSHIEHNPKNGFLKTTQIDLIKWILETLF